MPRQFDIGERVRALRKARGLSQRQLGERAETSGSYISQLESGSMPRPGAAQLQSIARAGLPPMRLHDLRHVYATLLLLQGVPIKVISEMLGHSSTAVTAEIYLHVLEEMKEQAARQIDEMLEDGT